MTGSVAFALYDLADVVNDQNLYDGGVLWGHNNDLNSGQWWQGIDPIWDVLTNFDPRPGNPDYDHCRNIYDFIQGWRELGYPVNANFRNLFEAHNVPIFLPGDYNDDGSIDVLDILAFINWRMKGYGNPPDHCAAADVNADCSIDILDIIYLIDYKYKSGPDLLMGCFEDPFWPQICDFN